MLGRRLALGALALFVGYEVYSMTSKPSPSSLSIESLLDETFSQPDISARLLADLTEALSPGGTAPSASQVAASMKNSALEIWKNGSADARGEVAVQSDGLAKNVDMDSEGTMNPDGSFNSKMTYKARKSAALSDRSVALLTEVADRYSERAVSGEPDPAKSAKVAAAIKEHFRAIEEARVKGSSVVGPAGTL